MSEDNKTYEVKYEDWIKIGLKYYGNKMDFKFKCVSCGNIQSINSILKENQELNKKEIGQWISFSCQGRFTDSNKGCNWTLGGFLHIHKFEVIFPDNHKMPTFEYENNEANQELKQLSCGDKK